jgi:LSD1 subclass zinc finger protein
MAKRVSSNLPPLQMISIDSVDGCRLLLNYPTGTKAALVQNITLIA